MKFRRVEVVKFKIFRIEIFEVVKKPYLMIRLYRHDNFVGQLFSSPEKWGFKIEVKLKELNKRGA